MKQPIKLVIFMLVTLWTTAIYAQTYKIVDTNQTKCYNNSQETGPPSKGQAFYGQDAQYNGSQTSYNDNGDGTVTDLNTGLIWQNNLPADKYNYADCVSYADTCTLAGYTDWRLPTIKELYSLILFSGRTGMTEAECIPYIDTDYFDFRFGGAVNAGERFIDAQYVTSTIYKGTTMGGNETMFGVNFVDGRIKGYPTFKEFEIRLVRGGNNYGVNDFLDNGDGTITDRATGFMWDQTGSSEGKNWETALAWVKEKNSEKYLGYSDWRLPNAKELHSITDYERSPSFTNSAAISPLFIIPEISDEGGNKNFPFYWTSTTHEDGPMAGGAAVYVCFGEGLGFMEQPPNSGNYILMDVHGAGAQRSDPKTGDPADFPNGRGPQGDVIRIYNYVRLVRDTDNTTGINYDQSNETNRPSEFELYQNYPNPFNPATTISFKLPVAGLVSLKIYSSTGQLISNLINQQFSSGLHKTEWQAKNFASGIYFYTLILNGTVGETRKMTLLQ